MIRITVRQSARRILVTIAAGSTVVTLDIPI